MSKHAMSSLKWVARSVQTVTCDQPTANSMATAVVIVEHAYWVVRTELSAVGPAALRRVLTVCDCDCALEPTCETPVRVNCPLRADCTARLILRSVLGEEGGTCCEGKKKENDSQNTARHEEGNIRYLVGVCVCVWCGVWVLCCIVLACFYVWVFVFCGFLIVSVCSFVGSRQG